MYLALKEMKKEKGRFVLIIGIVTLISYLVFFLTGLAYGLAKDNILAVELWKADKIVLKEGTNKNISSSMMEKEAIDDFKDYEISPVNLSRSTAYINGDQSESKTVDIVLMGLNQDSKAYPEVIEGEKPANKDEVLASVSFKEEEGLGLGDELELSMNDRVFKVVGFTEDSKYNVSPVIYTDLYEASQALLSYKEQVDEAKENMEADGASGATVSIPERIAGILVHGDSDISSDENYDVIPMGKFIKKVPGFLAQVLTFGLMIIFLIMISTIVLGVFMYIITMQKKQTFGIMKVQGISNFYISKSVIMQTFIVSLTGVVIGLLLTIGSEYLLPASVPFRSSYVFYGIISVLIILISMLGAIFSVRSVSKVDPLEVLD